jgi:hypothetical protein
MSSGNRAMFSKNTMSAHLITVFSLWVEETNNRVLDVDFPCGLRVRWATVLLEHGAHQLVVAPFPCLLQISFDAAQVALHAQCYENTFKPFPCRVEIPGKSKVVSASCYARVVGTIYSIHECGDSCLPLVLKHFPGFHEKFPCSKSY